MFEIYYVDIGVQTPKFLGYLLFLKEILGTEKLERYRWRSVNSTSDPRADVVQKLQMYQSGER